ncbi:MAG TPA: hypothetical protein VMT62_09400, partial [Syntrophorhabdaceae bacterium]|nr:hypothetical protein [Syntrophorhabdaceae bacterium]
KIEWTPTFPEIQTAARKALAIEQSPFSRDTLADYAGAVCTIYSMNVVRFQNECLKSAIENDMRSRKFETTVVVTGSDYKKVTFSTQRGTVRLKWSETLPVERRRGAPQSALKILRGPCNWIDPGDGYLPKPQVGDYAVIAGRPVFPYLAYGTIEALAKAVVDAVS